MYILLRVVFWDENEDFFFFGTSFCSWSSFLFLCRFLVHMEEAACVPHGATDWRCCDCVRSCRWLSAGKRLHTPRRKSSLLNTVPLMSHTRWPLANCTAGNHKSISREFFFPYPLRKRRGNIVHGFWNTCPMRICKIAVFFGFLVITVFRVFL